MTGLRAHSVSARRSTRTVLHEVSVAVESGELVAVVGPNGSGKSTLLEVLAGDRKPVRGEVLLAGRPLASLDRAQRARLRAVMTQENHVSFAFTVEQVVALGRSPWRNHSTPDQDAQAVAAALERVDAEHLRERPVTQLSGGERARVALARVLAQETGVLLLDEPTAALDLSHQESVMTTLRDSARGGAAVLVVLHDLDVAASYADRIVILDGGSAVADGPPATALDPALLQRVYGWPVAVTVEASGRLAVRPVRAAY